MSDIIDLPVQPAKSRVLITLVLDTSSSMAEQGRIGQLNAGLRRFGDELGANDYVLRTGEVAIVTFGLGHVRVVDPRGLAAGPPTEPFAPLRQFAPPMLQAGGATPMVEGIQQAFSLVQWRKGALRDQGLMLAHRPLVYMITDGQPTDAQGRLSDVWTTLVPTIRDLERNKHLLFFPFGVEGADESVLRALGPDSYKLLRDVDFGAALMLVSASIEALAGHRGSGDESAEEIHARVNYELSKRDRIMAFLQGSA